MCGIPKDHLGHPKSKDGVEISCNPLAQAHILNMEKTDFNVLVGLCVGHESIFHKNSEAPSSVLIVKDKSNGHKTIESI